MPNEDITELTSGMRSFAETVYYKYSEIERKHRFRFLFEPSRVLLQSEFIRKHIQGENPFPESVEIDPSNACNHDCPFCIYSSLHQKGRRERLADQRLLNLIDELYYLECKSILFIGGGEPLLHNKTADCIVKAAACGISVGLVTNGSLLRANVIEQIKGSATYVRISLDAATSKTHNTMHQAKDFEIIINNIKSFCMAKGCATLGVSYFVNENNYKEIFRAAKLVKDIGASYIQLKTYSGLAFEADLHHNILKEIDKSITLSDTQFDVHIMERLFNNSSFQVRGYSKCHWQAFKTIIGADGNVFLCAQKRNNKDAIIGNINSHSLKQIWSSELRQKVINNIKLKECPYCVHHSQNKLLDFLSSFQHPHKDFF